MGITENKNTVIRIAESVKKHGGTVYYVGGYVRDMVLGIENKDIDIEVHGVTPDVLESILSEHGTLIKIGNSFGVYGIKGYGIDIAMPRKETAIGGGHRDFNIVVDPFIGAEKAAIRRDFTVNALMQNVLTGEIVDCFGGLDDLKNKVLRHVNDKTFTEDALRVLRCAQFASRFEFTVDKRTVDLCKTVDLSGISKERVFDELKKALLKARKPSVFFDVLNSMNRLDFWFPEVKALIGTVQDERFHGEGDVMNHTMLTLDTAAEKRDTVHNALGFMLSALTHDFGKPLCTEVNASGIHSYRHESVGISVAEKFLNRLTSEKALIRYVLNMVKLHMKPNMMVSIGSSVKSMNRMFDDSADPYDLIMLSVCDDIASVSDNKTETNEKRLLESLDVYLEYMSRPYVTGKDLIDAGCESGERFSELLGYAHKLRLAGIDKETALKMTLNQK